MATAGAERPLNVVLIDGDPVQRKQIIAYLYEGRRPVEVTEIDTEHGFREALPRLIQYPPDLFIIEMIMRWSKCDFGLVPSSFPEDVRRGGRFRAGARIVELLAQSPIGNVPVVVHSVINAEDVYFDRRNAMDVLARHPHCLFIQKSRG